MHSTYVHVSEAEIQYNKFVTMGDTHMGYVHGIWTFFQTHVYTIVIKHNFILITCNHFNDFRLIHVCCVPVDYLCIHLPAFLCNSLSLIF